ncbi:hypothetical protein JAAARDRAFT_53592 [Jaapia argillacea MUCL 33604]|uniref:F-box domain-containing protein n=1 Tax=Jaapia argillacea MUCL 33604 TaxID=933084 RepID=A0A067Q8I8_9AGAM|nr:hypothetical protein JAAARDRAFT_53592 [Jaapia argillacea MUCL 33604]
MDSDSSAGELGGIGFKYHLHRPPYLKIYDQEEEEEVNQHERNLQLLTKGAENAFKPAQSHWKRFYHLLRLLGGIVGFHQGSLDLSGRHPYRYSSVKARWDKYIVDFTILMKNTVEVRDDIVFGEFVLPQVDFVITPPELLSDFCTKWRVAPTRYSRLYKETELVIKTLRDYPTPKMQQLVLTDLPPELLDLIMSHASQSKAQLLGSTCRSLRTISLRFIYKFRSLALEFNPKGVTVENRVQYLTALAQKSRERLMVITESLLSRPDILQNTSELVSNNDWHMDDRDVIEEILIPDVFYTPITERLADVISACNNLTHVSLSSWTIDQRMLFALTSLSHLHTLTVSRCSVDIPVEHLSLDLFPPSHSVVNLEIRLRPYVLDYPQSWPLIPFFPSARCLVMSEITESRFELPRHDFIRDHIPLCNLTRLQLEGLDDGHLLGDWLRVASRSGEGLRLTHFKLRAGYGMDSDEVFDLIDSLSKAPLQVLVLEGLDYVEFDLFDRIGAEFPSLIALTIIHRHSDRQRETNECLWPHAYWEYASRLQAFPRLEHLGLNFLFDWLHGSPNALLLAENDFPEEMWMQFAEDEYIPMNNSIPRAFGAYCPTLKTFSYEAKRGCSPLFKIWREADGSMGVTDDETALKEMFRHSKVYNPDGLLTRWLIPTPDLSRSTVLSCR